MLAFLPPRRWFGAAGQLGFNSSLKKLKLMYQEIDVGTGRKMSVVPATCVASLPSSSLSNLELQAQRWEV